MNIKKEKKKIILSTDSVLRDNAAKWGDRYHNTLKMMMPLLRVTGITLDFRPPKKTIPLIDTAGLLERPSSQSKEREREKGENLSL